MKLLLTGGLVGVALAVTSLVSYLKGTIVVPGPEGRPLIEFMLSPWAVATVMLSFLSLVQYRMWADLRDQVQAFAATLYRHHPIVDEGIDLHQVRLQSSVTGPGRRSGRPYRQITAYLEERRAAELLVTCDGDSEVSYAVMHWLLPEDQRGPRDPRSGFAGVGRAQAKAAMVTPNSFRLEAPSQSYPVEVTLQVHGDPTPVVMCIEWL